MKIEARVPEAVYWDWTAGFAAVGGGIRHASEDFRLEAALAIRLEPFHACDALLASPALQGCRHYEYQSGNGP